MLKTQVIGNLGKDAVSNEVNGKLVINFSVAHTEKYKNHEGVETIKTTWLECACWYYKTISILAYLKQGAQVFVEGTPELGTYTNQQGVTMPKLKLRVDTLVLLDKKEKE